MLKRDVGHVGYIMSLIISLVFFSFTPVSFTPVSINYAKLPDRSTVG